MATSRSSKRSTPTIPEAELAMLKETNALLVLQQKKLEQELYETRFSLNSFLETHQAVHYIVYPHVSEHNFFSARWEELLGFAPRQVRDPLCEKKNLVLFSSLNAYERGMDTLHTTKRASLKYQLQHPRTGKVLWLQEEIAIKYDLLRDQEVIAGIITDISEAEFYKEYIIESETRFKKITDALPFIVWVSNEENVITYMNEKAYVAFNIEKDQVSRLEEFEQAVDPAYRQIFLRDFIGRVRKREPVNTQLLVRVSETQELFLSLEANPRYLPNGQFFGYVGATYDLSKEYEYKQGMESAYSALQSSEQKYQRLFENMQLGVLEVDQEEKILFANDAFLKICGYTLKELIGKKADALLVDDEESHRTIRQQQGIRASGVESAYEIKLKKKNGQTALLIISGAPLLDATGKVRGSVGIHWDVTELRKMEQRLMEARLQAEETQRMQIGRDLHDGIGQVLVYLAMHIGVMRLKEKVDTEELDQLENSVRNAIEQVRTLSRTLTPPALQDLGLRDAVKELIGTYDLIQQPVFQLTLYPQAEDYNLSMGKKVVIYRILQELLANTLKHAKASQVTIHLYFDKKGFHLEYSDDGRGYDPGQIKKGVGLESIRSRIAFYQGKITTMSAPGKGNKVAVQLPLP